MSDVKALFGLIDKKNKRRLIGAVICCVLSVLCLHCFIKFRPFLIHIQSSLKF